MKNIKPRNIFLFLFFIALFVWLVNPSWIPLGEETREALGSSLASAFGTGVKESGFSLSLPHLITAAAITALMWGIYLFCSFLLRVCTRKSKRSITVSSLLSSVLRYASVLITVFWVLSALGVNTATMFASAGVVALIIGFGAQSLIEDILTGIFIIFEHQYSVGDIIIS